jgi:hypothetical protein
VRNPSRVDEQDAWKKASGGDNAVPLLVIGTSRTLKGFQEPEWNVALDAAGYPRGAPALKPQSIPPASDPVAQRPAAQPAEQPGTQTAAQEAAQQAVPAKK